MNSSTIQQFNNKSGFLLVFEGIDGSGKTTQIELLKKFLASQGVAWEAISFPQYGKNEFANKIYDYLAGKLGKLNEVDPYFIAKTYAGDRQTAKDLINDWLEAGKMVIANRYVSSSKAHLGANLGANKRDEFFEWLDKLEYETNGIPKENISILLAIDPKIGQRNVRIERKGDIHESSLNHLMEASKIYLELAKLDSSWYVIDCMDNAQMRTKEEIHQEIVRILEKLKILEKIVHEY